MYNTALFIMHQFVKLLFFQTNKITWKIWGNDGVRLNYETQCINSLDMKSRIMAIISSCLFCQSNKKFKIFYKYFFILFLLVSKQFHFTLMFFIRTMCCCRYIICLCFCYLLCCVVFVLITLLLSPRLHLYLVWANRISF